MPSRASIQGPDIGRLMYNIGSSIKRGSIVTITKAAQKAKEIEEKEIRPATGGNMRLSGVGRVRGRPGDARVGVRYDIYASGEIPTARIRATGPLHLIERPTSPHYVTSAWSRGSRRTRAGRLGGAASVTKRGQATIGSDTGGALFGSTGSTAGTGGRRAVLNIPGIGFRRYAASKGTRGKYPFAKGQAKAVQPVTRIMRTRTFNIIKEAAKP